MTDSLQGFDLLRARYAQSLPSKHEALADAWHAFVATPDERTLRAVHEQAHRLSGSAAVYGYEPLGDRARAIDCALCEWEDAPAASRDDARELPRRLAAPMQSLLDALRECAERGS